MIKKSLKIREIATPVCALARNDKVFRQSPYANPRFTRRGFYGMIILCDYLKSTFKNVITLAMMQITPQIRLTINANSVGSAFRTHSPYRTL